MNISHLLGTLALSALLASTYAQSASATVDVNVQYTWRATDDNNYPGIAHFSPMVCAVSKSDVLFVVNGTASNGFRTLAEAGVSKTLLEDLREKNEQVTQVIELDGTSIGTSVGKREATLKVTSDAPYVACVSMIAPSPDWVVGWTSTKLFNSTTGEFIESGSRPLRPYDAGTDSGKTYLAEPDEPTNPRAPIRRLTPGGEEQVIEQYGTINMTVRSTTGGESGTSGEDSECFPADATVELDDGSFIRMEDVKIGDRVKVGGNQFSPVFMFTHKLKNVVSDFVEISTASGAKLPVTKGHYLYIDGILQAAKDVPTGSHVELGDGNKDIVVDIKYNKKEGLYNPQTMHGDIVANGIRASTYTTAIEPKIAHALLAPFRMLYRLGISNPSRGLLDSGSLRLAHLFISNRKHVEL